MGRQAGEEVQGGGGTAGVEVADGAADLSPRRSDRSRRLAKAAYFGADVTGELHNASQFLVDARRENPEFRGSLQAAITASYLLVNGEGDVDTAHRLLVEAIETRIGRPDTDDDALNEALHTRQAARRDRSA